MKKYFKFIFFLIIGTALLTSCNSIEDSSDFDKAGTPITSEDLKAALSYVQLPNQENSVVGDQYIIVKNKRPDIGGTWHLVRGDTEKTYATDNDTLICTDNGDYKLYYVGISANQVVKTEPFEFTVTNVFDEWSGYLTGAKDKSDLTATKTWTFREVKWASTTSICNNGAYGGWKYTNAGYTPESNFMWWGNHTMADAGGQKMVFEYKDNKLTIYGTDGSKKYEGKFSFTHNTPDAMVLGELITNVPLIGAQWDDCAPQKQGVSNVFWILTCTEDYITIFHPEKYTGGVDWDNCGWYAYFKSEK